MIEISDLSKVYGPHTAIDQLNFNVQKGEVVGFLGPNGAGKSTTMKIITGYMAPTSGAVKVAGFDVFESPIEVKKRIGYLPEIPPVYGDMLVGDYLHFVACLKGVSKERVKSCVERAIEKTHLEEVSSRMIQNLSKGFRQRVGIAQAIVSDPEVLILDEPTAGLDPKQVAEIRQLINQLKGEHTIILSTHILPEVQATCEKVIIINRGRIVAEDSLNGLSRRMSGSRRVHLKVRRSEEELCRSLNGLSGVLHVDRSSENGALQIDVEDSDEVIEKLSALVVTNNHGLVEFRSLDASLEDVFLKLTGDGVSAEVAQ